MAAAAARITPPLPTLVEDAQFDFDQLAEVEFGRSRTEGVCSFSSYLLLLHSLLLLLIFFLFFFYFFFFFFIFVFLFLSPNTST